MLTSQLLKGKTMKIYKVTDIFSYLPKDIIGLDRLEEIFKQGINVPEKSINCYNVKKCVEENEFEEMFKPVVNELKSENKYVAFILKNEKIVAVVGYRVNNEVK